MPYTTADLLLRDFVEHTGDAAPHPLPKGNPASGVHNPSKKDLRDAINSLLGPVDTVVRALTADAAAYAMGAAPDARADLLFWQTIATGDPASVNSQEGLSVATGDADFGKCLKRTITAATTGAIVTRGAWRTKGAHIRVRARFKLVSISAGTTADFDLRMYRLNDDWTSPGSAGTPGVTVSVGSVTELDAVFSAEAFATSVVAAGMATGPYARFGLRMTAGSAVTAEVHLESLVVQDITHVVRSTGMEITGRGDDYTPFTLRSGEDYHNGSGVVPRVPRTGLFNIKNASGAIQMVMWADLQGDGDYDCDIGGVGNLYMCVSAQYHFRFGDLAGAIGGGAFGEQGRITLGCFANGGPGNGNVNCLRSGVDFAGGTLNHFAIGPYGSTNWWQFFDSSTGNIGMGLHRAGVTAPTAALHVVGVGEAVARLRSTQPTAYMQLRGSSQSVDDAAGVGVNSSGQLLLRAQSGDHMLLSSTVLRPLVDGAIGLGLGSFRLGQIFSTVATISTSDEREKQDIGAIPDEWLDAWGDVEWVRYRWKDAVAAKGDHARWHFGLIAQRVAAAFEARGIDPFSIGLVCHDAWEDEYEPIFAVRDVTVTRYRERDVHDPIGVDPATGKTLFARRVVVEPYEAIEQESYDTGERRLVQAAGERFGLRYEEAFAIEAAWVRRRMDRLEAAMVAK